MKTKVMELQKANAPLIPVTVDDNGKLLHLYGKDSSKNLNNVTLPEGWTNFYRSDDVSATAYFYLDRPASGLSELKPLAIRTFKLK